MNLSHLSQLQLHVKHVKLYMWLIRKLTGMLSVNEGPFAFLAPQSDWRPILPPGIHAFW